MTTRLAPVCGVYCGSCDFFEDNCPGCEAVAGIPFWIQFTEWQICPLFDCCKNEHHLEHCGLCSDYPCQQFLEMELHDPSLTTEQAHRSLQQREDALARRWKIGTEAWVKEQEGRMNRIVI